MLILLVEDEAPKAQKVKGCISEVFVDSEFHVCRSVRSGMDYIDRNRYDLVVLDMSLPTFDIGEDEFGGRPQGFGGVEIMRDMQNNEILTPVIVVTAYETFPLLGDEESEPSKEVSILELSHMLKEEFPENFVELIRYDTYLSDWKDSLVLSIKSLGASEK
ncbi:response regulator [uncultured Marinobacter sp.]|uniref:response regulator n=1 Tax=uncultured Marinobacter sp. TaxID=187379 RepID=UPI002598D6A3|nr:response regulator [uncultured Marinobacter sp.]